MPGIALVEQCEDSALQEFDLDIKVEVAGIGGAPASSDLSAICWLTTEHCPTGISGCYCS
ncbi:MULTISPECIES: FDLD family class I lanthipeptide [Streptomyces]|uniref:Lantibiotic n=2 Tax=Streptomyces TaxID=1883 RepID=A0A0B5ERX8_STRA4|nr:MULTISPECIES: FDLD family class I lanthipeptide [Streptomyces]AJE81516.1 hypothetical protein SLNWT_1140 [Streptomyces albus]AOU75831.1 hypothetical protein SLNHY_1140 [Streptomyces albus]AYN31637.1 hypothetical protein DUI70_1134 [Streptomyces albus]NKI42864.1 hypothetical protein [Streptomyces physcomitrii]